MKDIVIQVVMGVLMAGVAIFMMCLIVDAQKHNVNYDLILDKREWSCVESKTERYTTAVMAGKVPIVQFHNREVCITMKRN